VTGFDNLQRVVHYNGCVGRDHHCVVIHSCVICNNLEGLSIESREHLPTP